MRVLEVFAPLFGHWQGSEEQPASSEGPATTARAMIAFRAELGGAAVVSDYRQVRADGTELAAHGVFLVDDRLTVRWWRFDSTGRPPVPAVGGWRDGALELTETTDGGPAVHRFGIEGDVLTYAIDAGPDGDRLEPRLRGRYAAISTH